MKSKSIELVPFLLLAAVPTVAQVPVGGAARICQAQASGGPTLSLELVDVVAQTGTATTGLPADLPLTAGVLDPVTGELVVARQGTPPFGSPAPNRIFRLSLTGTSVSAQPLGSSGTSDIDAIDFDRNGDAFFCDGVGVHRLDRATNAITLWDTDTYPGGLNALAIDRERDLLWVATFSTFQSALIRYDLTAGPGPGTVVADPSLIAGDVAGMAVSPSGEVYLCTFEETSSILRFDPATGLLSAVPGAPSVGLNAIAYDRVFDRLHGTSVFTPNDDYHLLHVPSGAASSFFPGLEVGTGTALWVNDLIDRTEVFPQRPSVSADFLLEAAAHGTPGAIAAVGIVAVNGTPVIPPTVLGAGSCDSGGFFTVSANVDASLLNAGDVITFQSARLQPATFELVFGTMVDVVLQP